MTDRAGAYRGVRVRVRELVGESDGDRYTVTPATPEWTVHDVVAHLGGITADIVAGNLDGVGTDPWTAVQVAARHETGEVTCGSGAPSATLQLSRFEFTRAVTGRRSVDQLASYEWNGDARPDLLVFAPFTPRRAALIE